MEDDAEASSDAAGGQPGQLPVGRRRLLLARSSQGRASEACGRVVKWYRLAAENGAAVAQVEPGFMYSDGTGVPKEDAAEA